MLLFYSGILFKSRILLGFAFGVCGSASCFGGAGCKGFKYFESAAWASDALNLLRSDFVRGAQLQVLKLLF